MSDFMDRNAIVDQIVTDLIAAGNPTYTKLNGLTAENIKYSEENPLELDVTRNPIEIWVAPGGGNSQRISNVKFDTWFTVRIMVLITGWEGVTDKKSAVDISQDIERYYKSNPDIGFGPRLAMVANPGTMEMDDQTYYVNTPQGSAGCINFRLIDMLTYKMETG
jgi:hypothetical protein